MPESIPGSRMIKDGKVGKVGRAGSRSLKALLLRSVLLLPVFPVLPVLSQQNLAQRIEARLNTVPFNRQLWGIALLDESGRLIYGQNATRMFVPASTTKLVVTAAATAAATLRRCKPCIRCNHCSGSNNDAPVAI
jgi:D-alanyl-D-alanine carboxypeptidase